MNKVGLIIQREYITRVSNKRFLLTTFLIPVIFILFIAGSAYFANSSKQEIRIAVINDPGFLEQHIKSEKGNVVFDFTKEADSINYKNKEKNQ